MLKRATRGIGRRLAAVIVAGSLLVTGLGTTGHAAVSGKRVRP